MGEKMWDLTDPIWQDLINLKAGMDETAKQDGEWTIAFSYSHHSGGLVVWWWWW
jgi:hypothetical protein